MPDSGTITVDLPRREVAISGQSPAAALLSALAKADFPARLITEG